MIQLTENANEEVRRNIFERLNRGSVPLNEMETRIGISRGRFLDLIEKLSENSKFRSLCSFSEIAIRSREPQEFVLRFFAFLNNYKDFSKVNQFLDDYLTNLNQNDSLDLDKMQDEFELMIDFVDKYFPKGFRQGKNYNRTTTRIKFESLAVGIALALREKRDLKPNSIEWINSDEFKNYTKSDASSSKNKVIRRIEYVRDQLLNKS